VQTKRVGFITPLNRGNARSTIFHKPEDYDAFEQILAEGLERYACRILAYQLMPNHWHFVLQPTEDGGMSNFLRWVSLSSSPRRGSDSHSPGQSVRGAAAKRRLGSKAPEDPSPRRGTTRPRTGCAHDHCETAVNGWARFAGFDGENECQRIGHVPRDVGIWTFSTHGFARF
jgi:REP element-mobilizing transposase RayT